MPLLKVFMLQTEIISHPNEWPPSSSRGLFIFDFSCALAAGIVYFSLIDFMTETLALPRWLVQTQLLANLLYGLYGALLFAGRITRPGYFRFLVAMNFLYAGFCIAVGLALSLSGTHWGALLLLFEGAFIAALAQLERSSISSSLSEKRKQETSV
jgi:hypothetical protein